MKKKITIIFSLATIIFLVIWYIAMYHITSVVNDTLVLLAGLGCIMTLYLLDRINIFKKKLALALKHILENNFQTGMSMSGSDELTGLSSDFNLAIDRINHYDLLRENQIICLNRIISMLNRNIQNGVMILDLDSARIKINRAAQEMFGVNQDDLSIDSVTKLNANSEFNRLYQEIIAGRANTIAGTFELFLPILRAKASVNMKMFAIKDKDEKLDTIICIFTKTSIAVDSSPEAV
ncbi:MAG: hypothetical protein GY853_11090 [PVC group bacterium]|nr:hypothetical protein [PVC group bacterium]